MMNKRIISITVILSVILSMCVFTLNANAAIGIAHEEQVSKLNAFGILSGYPDKNYKADAQVSAKDFVEAAYKLTGHGSGATELVADKFGFSSNDKSISVQNAVSTVLYLLEYESLANALGGYPNGYKKAALETELLNGISISFDGKLTNDAMALMLYNALEMRVPKLSHKANGVDFAYGDETVMEKLEIFEGKGIVTGTPYSALRGYSSSKAGNVIIDGKNYGLGRTYADELLGYNVEFYYNEDRELLWIEQKDTMEVIRVAEEDITAIDNSAINYFDGNKKNKCTFDNPTFVYNGKRVDSPDFGSFIPSSGYVVLIDNDGDSRVEVVACESYEYYLVDAINTENMYISDYEQGKKLSFDRFDYDKLTIIKDGMRVGFSDIKQKNIIAVMKSEGNDGAIMKVIVSPYAPVSGILSLISDTELEIDGNTYYKSSAYSGTQLAVNLTGTFYRDINGNIVRYSKEKNITSKYSYVIHTYTDEVEDGYIRLLTAGGDVITYKLRTKLRYNNRTETATNVVNYLRAENQLITYSLNSDGEVIKIETADKTPFYSGNDDESSAFSLYFKGHGRYRKNNMCFNTKYLLEADTPIFVVPASRETGDYKVMYASSLSNGVSYHISVYDIDEYMVAGAIVLDELSTEPEQLKAKRSILVEKIVNGINEEDEEVLIVTGYQQGSKITLRTDEKSLKDAEGAYYSLGHVEGYSAIRAGDIIQVSLAPEGHILAFRTLYKIDEEDKKLVMASNSTPNEYEEGGNINEFSDLFILCGTVTSRTDTVLVVRSDTKRAHKITNGASVYFVDSRGIIEKGSVSDISASDEVYLHTYQGNLHEVVIYR